MDHDKEDLKKAKQFKNVMKLIDDYLIFIDTPYDADSVPNIKYFNELQKVIAKFDKTDVKQYDKIMLKNLAFYFINNRIKLQDFKIILNIFKNELLMGKFLTSLEHKEIRLYLNKQPLYSKKHNLIIRKILNRYFDTFLRNSTQSVKALNKILKMLENIDKDDLSNPRIKSLLDEIKNYIQKLDETGER